MRTAQEHAERAAKTYADLKRSNGTDQSIPILEVWNDGTMVVMYLEDRALLSTVARTILREQRPEALVFSAEVWMREAEPGEGAPPAGQLGVDFGQGDARVRESLVTVAVTRPGWDVAHIIQPFVYDDQGKPVIGRDLDDGSILQSAVLADLRAAWI